MERDLILEAKNGSDPAFSELTKRYAPLIDSMADKYFRLLEETEAGYEDIRQEAHLAFYRALITFDATQDKVSFGLYAKICIRNRMISILRKNRSEKKHNAKATKLGEGQIPEKSSTVDYRELLSLAESLLTEYEKTVFYMYLGGQSYKEIALSLGRTEKSVDNALFRAKAKLRSGYPM